ncbi:class I SAM-dependent methyltransferase [Phenylobacterium montanum]|uniref:Class I SAM-dependent methyltransferase n=1 Tax=Phenylobacterium montanum TaxID=2823693 RepID=A0A975G353_9CAUL|nr:class I SAM-dependent methyltransferase [Caulobacter sp. S6]QUD89679.1 class I SAM-dependent methyltransferase [Caulobacter sp. S6]
MSDASFVGDIPANYDRYLGPIIFEDFAVETATRVAKLSPMHVLETAAGTGIVTRELRRRLPAGSALTATDFNRPMLDLARAKFDPAERVTFEVADATALPFGESSFDAVVCQFGLMFFPDLEGSYREALRVLAPGGRYVFSVWDSHQHNPFGRIAHEVAGRLFPADPPPFYLAPFSRHQMDPIKEALIQAGFGDLEIAVVAHPKTVSDASAFARGLVFGNPMADQIRARGADPDPLVAALTDALRREVDRNGGEVRLQMIIFTARKPHP